MYVLHFGAFFRKPEKLGSHTGSKWWPGDPDVKDHPNGPLTRWPNDRVPCLVHGHWPGEGTRNRWCSCIKATVVPSTIARRRQWQRLRNRKGYLATRIGEYESEGLMKWYALLSHVRLSTYRLQPTRQMTIFIRRYQWEPVAMKSIKSWLT